MSGWFITGTDTGVGKTEVAVGLLDAFARAGHAVVGMKPVASGCRITPAGLRHADAERLLAASTVAAAYADVNPYAFAPAIAPHLAAAAAGVDIDLRRVASHFERLQRMAARVVVEGAGGWAVPLSERASMADLARELRLPVILVVGLRLGCLNHALLTVGAIQAGGARLAGWVANGIDPDFDCIAENVTTLTKRIAAPLLATIPYAPDADFSPAIRDHLVDVPHLLQHAHQY